MPAAPSQRALAAVGAAVFALTTLLLGFSGAPGSGIGRLFYFGIVLIAFATGPAVGAVAGGVASALFALAVIANPQLSLSEIESSDNALRWLSYLGVGLLVGWFAAQNRELTERLRLLAKVDPVTGIANLRSFEETITRLLDAAAPFTLFILECGDDAGWGDEHVATEAVQLAAAQLFRETGAPADAARIGTTQFAILLASDPAPAATAARLELLLAAPDRHVVTGWAVHPVDGSNALALHRAAVERIYVRRLLRPAAAAGASA
jgi:GGDEF domain-containing protein